MSGISKKIRSKWRQAVPFIRLPLSNLCLIPDFLILGAQKSGTSSLFLYLSQHPDILSPCVNKELHYFDLNFKQPSKWYRAHFPFKKQGKITGEKSPYYIFHPLAPRRCREFNPEFKLIALLRDPVKRAYSHFHHEIENRRESRPFRRAVEEEMDRVEKDHDLLYQGNIDHSFAHQRYSYFARGRYADQLDLWTRFFPRKQIYLETAERFFRHPQQVCAEIFGFLNVSSRKISATKKHNKGTYDPISSSDQSWLTGLFREHNLRLADKYGVNINDWT